MNETTVPGKKSRVRKVLRILGVGVVLVAVALTIAHFAWKYSGSGQWEQVSDKDGIKVLVRKSPGSTLKDIRGVTRMNVRLMTAVAALAAEQSNEDCSTWIEGCLGQKTIVPYNRHKLTVTELITVKYPGLFSPREFLVAMKVTQDAATKAVTIDYKAVPNLVPLNSCCYRVPDMHNVWVFAPAKAGGLDVEYTMHLDQGIPYFMFNHVAPQIVHDLVRDLPQHHAKYQNAKVENIQE
ncbi:MAG: hypothetical protein QOH21_2317 [Acidobacteriota bacterium]|nr:hypothetical protein [Acidobacteriota bacterium]